MKSLTLGLTLASWGCFGLGYAVRGVVERSASACVECCAEGEICENEEQWAGVLMDATHDKADAEELARMVNDCWKERGAAELASTAATLVLQECRGKLKVYELDAPP